jgi:hypothetical protein
MNAHHLAEATKEYHEDRKKEERQYAHETFDELVDRLARMPAHAYDIVRNDTPTRKAFAPLPSTRPSQKGGRRLPVRRATTSVKATR